MSVQLLVFGAMPVVEVKLTLPRLVEYAEIAPVTIKLEAATFVSTT